MTAWIALVIAALSLSVSAYSLWRTLKRERVHAWAEVERTTTPRLYLLTVHLRNPTQYVLKVESLYTPQDRVPLDERQGFFLVQADAFQGKTEEWANQNQDNVESGFKLPVSGVIQPGETGSVKMLLLRGRLSAALRARVTIFYWSMENTAKYKNQVVTANVPTGGIKFKLG
jgi:hypothetical protein